MLSFPEGTLRAYCAAVGIEYQDSMVHWGQITPEQKEIFRHRLDHVYDTAITFLGNVLNATEFAQMEPSAVHMDEIDQEFKGIVEENIPIYEKLREYRLKPVEFEKENIEDFLI